MNLLLLCAGFATRLYPLTRDRAKPLLEVGGRPVLSRILDTTRELELEQGVLVHNARFADAFGEWVAAEPGPVPFDCVNDGAVEEPEKLGGIGDMDLGLARLEELNPGRPTLVLAGDNLIEFSLAPYAEQFRAHGHPLVLARRIPGEVPPNQYGEITADENDRVVRFREKPDDPRSQLAATCLYFFPPGIHAETRSYLMEGGDPDAPGHFIGWLSKRREVRVAPFSGKLWDIGDRASLEACRAAMG